MNRLPHLRESTETERTQKLRERGELRLQGKLESSVEAAEKNGVTAGVCILSMRGGVKRSFYEHNAGLGMHPASIIKVAQAIYAGEKISNLTLEQLYDEYAVDWSDYTDDDFPQQAGAGVYDDPEAPRHASYEQLFTDMLSAGKSGNMAAKVLTGKNATADFNEYWEGRGFESLRLTPHGDWYTIEDALPAELAQLTGEISRADISGNARTIITEALQGKGKFGTVSGSIDTENSEHGIVISKTGELPPDSDTPYHMRHALGEVIGPDASFSFAIMTQAPDRLALVSSLQLIDELGALMGKEAGLNVASRTRRVMARYGIRAAGVPIRTIN